MLYTYMAAFSSSSGQINSYHYRDATSEKEFICSTEDSAGMHKCNNLPPFNTKGQECNARYYILQYHLYQCLIIVHLLQHGQSTS
jgi:hypothetical protein